MVSRTAIIFSVMLSAGAGTAYGAPEYQIELGPADGLLLGNPTALIGLEDAGNPGVLVGPEVFNTFVLDTAASGILFAQLSYYDENFEVDSDLYGVAQNGGSDVQYEEQGTGGSALLDVFVPYNVNISGTGEGSTTFVAGNFRAFGSPDVDLFDIAGLAGMPVMVNHDLRVNLKDLVNIESEAGPAITTVFDDVPAATATTYTIALERFPSVHTGQQNLGDPLPSFEDIPMIEGVKFSHLGESVAKNMIVDTGASVTFISTATALSLGIDPETDAIDFIEIGGLGGTGFFPVVHVNRMAIPTEQEVDLVFDNMDVIVLDIEGIDAVLGMDVIGGGYTEPYIDAIFAWLLGGTTSGEYGYFSDMIFDFVGPEWSMRMDVNPAFGDVTMLGDLNGDGTIGVYELNAVKGSFGTDDAAADINGDGIVDVDDFIYVKNHFGEMLPPGLAFVPEPGMGVLLSLSGVMMLRRIAKPQAAESPGRAGG